MPFFSTLVRNRRAATAIEYGLITALIAVAALAAMQGLGTSVSTTFNNATAGMERLIQVKKPVPL